MSREVTGRNRAEGAEHPALAAVGEEVAAREAQDRVTRPFRLGRARRLVANVTAATVWSLPPLPVVIWFAGY